MLVSERPKPQVQHTSRLTWAGDFLRDVEYEEGDRIYEYSKRMDIKIKTDR